METKRNDRVGKVTLWGGVGTAVIGAAMIGTLLFPGAAGATQPNPEHKVTICHATSSYTNPYNEITVDVASILTSGHSGHTGPVFYADIPKHTDWGDIIPAFDFGPGEQYDGMNIPAGQAILDNGCELPVEETTTTVEDTTTTEETTTTVEETTTTVEETTTSSVLASTTEQEFTTTTEASTTEAPTTLPTDVQPDELARTGSDAGTTAGMGLALLTTGGVLVVAGRRRSALNR